ncbi:putative ribonuclease H-like domain-containing protein [Tanacetum coccineum]
MSTRDKTSLGYSIQLNELSSNHETDSENSFSVFDGRSSDEESTLANDRSSKADGYKAVPPPITRNFLTPRADISFAGLDEYAIRNKIIESQTTKLNTKTSKTTSKTNDANTKKPKSVSESVVSNPKINRDSVIIEDWNSDDEEEGYEMQTVRLETQTVKTRDDKSGVLTRTRFVSTARLSISTARPSISTARPVCTARLSISTARPSISTARPVCTARPSISTAKPRYASRPIYPRMDNIRPKGSCSPIKRSYYTKPAFRPKDLKQDVKTFRVKNMTTAGKRAVINTGKGKLDSDLKKSRWVWRPKGNYLDHGNLEILLQNHAVVDSGCSSYMTGNKAYLLDYEDFNGGFVAFGSDPKGGLSGKDKGPTQEYILLLLQPHKTRIPLNDVVQIAQEKLLKSSPDKDIQILKMFFEKEGQHHMPEDEQHLKKKRGKLHLKKKADQATNTNTLSTDRPFVSTDRPFVSTDRSNTPYVSTASTPTGAQCWSNQSVSILEAKYLNDASTLPNANYPLIQICLTWKMLLILSQMMEYSIELIRDEDVGAVADFNNMDNTIAVSPIPTLRILGDPTSAVQTRGKIQKASSAQQALVSYIYRQNRTNHKDHQNCLFACFLSQEEPKTISQALQDESWVKAMQEELLQFKLQKVWVLVDFPYGKKVIGTKWVFRNKRDERSIVVKNKARFVAQRFRQEEGKRLMMSAFLYGAIKEEVYVHQPPGFVDHCSLQTKSIKRDTIDKTLFVKKKKSDIMLVQVYVDDIIFGSTTKSMCTEFEECTHKRFQMSFMGELTFFLGLQVKQQSDRIFISQDKYVADILKKFDFLSIRTATTPIESNKPLVKDEDGVDVDVHVYRDCYEKRLIEVIKIHTDHNAAVPFSQRDLYVTEYSDKHNMLAFLKKPNESVGFTEVVDFIKVRTLANGTQQLVASIYSKEYTITEASVRSKLQLADATRIHNLSDAKIYAGLATLSPKSGGWNQFGDIVPLMPAMLAGAAMDQGEGSAQPAEPHPTPVDPLPSTSLPPNQSPPHSPHQSPPHSPHQSPPHSPFQSPPYSPPHSSPPRSYEAPLPEGNTSGSVEASIQLKELMILVTVIFYLGRLGLLVFRKELKDTNRP